MRLVWADGEYRGRLLDWVLERFKFVLEVVLRWERDRRPEVFRQESNLPLAVRGEHATQLWAYAHFR